MVDFETENFAAILNSENMKDDEVDNLTFKDDVFDINEDFEESDDDQESGESDGEESEKESDNESASDADDKHIDVSDFLGDEEPDPKQSYKARGKESEKLENLLTDKKKNNGKYENLIFKITNDYDRIKTITSSKTLPETFPPISEIKTTRHAEEVYRLTSKKLNSLIVNDAIVEVIPMIGDILSFIFNGDRNMFGYKPDLKGYSLKLRTKLSYCNNDIGSMSDSLVQFPIVSQLIKTFSIFGIPLISTLKENSDRSKQGLKKEKLIELNNKINKNNNS